MSGEQTYKTKGAPDAPVVRSIRAHVGQSVAARLNVLDYEIRKNAKGTDNWIKLLISYDETDADGMPTGREIVREMHGDYAGLHRYIRSAERAFGGKQAILPIEDAEIINSCGYIFKGSTNMMEYIEDFHNQSTLQQSF